MNNGKPFFERKTVKIIKRVIIIAFWVALIGFCIYYHDEITVERIVSLIPKNSAVSVIVMLLLYAIKGLAVFIYGGILYAAGGILFSLPVAIIIGTLGTAIMISVPFFIGKKAGAHSVESLVKKNKKLEIILDMQNKNELWVSFFIRMVGLLPADVVAMYLGASGMKYKNYFIGSMLGLFPSVLCFSIMGMSIDDVGSPEFIISLCVEVGLMVASVIFYFVRRGITKKRRARLEEVSDGGEREEF